MRTNLKCRRVSRSSNYAFEVEMAPSTSKVQLHAIIARRTRFWIRISHHHIKDGMSKNPVHIYRAILRECTYLPDPNSQTFIRGWARDSFRRYLPRDPQKPQCKPEEITPLREGQVLRRARHLQHTLSRANEGYPNSFEKVLRWTYARTGKRRREMLSELTAQEPSDSELQEHGASTPRKFDKHWEAPATIKALLRTQTQETRFMAWQSKRVRPEGAKIPEKNLWGKPMPECRVRNQRHDWYKDQLQLILPPLPEAEFAEIKAYATGEKRLLVKARRPMALVLVFSEPEREERSLLAEAPMAVEWNTRQPQKPHELTQRSLRRHMQRLLAHVPVAVASKGETEVLEGAERKPEAPLAIKWDRVESDKWKIGATTGVQAKALFG